MKKMTKGELQVRSRELQSQMSELNDKVYNEKRNFTEEEQNKWDALTREKTLVDAEIRAQLRVSSSVNCCAKHATAASSVKSCSSPLTPT